jgi:hypothetical protein
MDGMRCRMGRGNRGEQTPEESGMTEQHPWLANYPEGVPAQINPD